MIKLNDVLLVKWEDDSCELGVVVGFSKLVNDMMGVDVFFGQKGRSTTLGPVCFKGDQNNMYAENLGPLGEDEL